MPGHNYVQPLEADDPEQLSETSPLTPSHSASIANTISTSLDPIPVKDEDLDLSPSEGCPVSQTEASPVEELSTNGASHNVMILPAPLPNKDSTPCGDSSMSMPQKDAIQPVTIAEELETVQEKAVRKQSHRIIYFTAFLMSMGFSIVLTSVWPYLKQLDPSSSKVFYGLVIAVNPLGQLLTAPALGWWGNKFGSNRPPFLVSIFFFVLGNVGYALLRLMGSTVAAYSLMFSRFIVGIGSANIALCRSYLSASTTLSERSTALSYCSAAQSIGLIIGPAIQTVLALAIPAVEMASINSGNSSSTTTGAAGVGGYSHPATVWDLYTAAGWIAAVLGLVNLILFLPGIYKEVNISVREAELMKQRVQNTSEKYPPADYLAVFIVLLNFFFILFVYVLLETIIVPMGKDLYAWSSEYAIKVVGIGLSVIGVLAFFMFFVCSVLCDRFDERKVYIFVGIVPLILGMIVHIPMGHNYAIMQNCTHSGSHNASFHTTFITTTASPEYLTSVATSGSFDPSLLRERRGASHEFNDPPYQNLQSAGSESMFSRLSASYPVSLSRSKRAVILDDEDGCDAVGCPVSQTWCRDTPIVELPQLLVGNLLGVIGYPVAFTLSSSLFSKMIGPNNQGVWMGLLTSTGSLSRMSGPIFVTWVYSSFGTRWTFGLLTAALTLSLLLAVIFFKRLVPMDINKNNPENENMLNQEV